jgi:hypothetical protein
MRHTGMSRRNWIQWLNFQAPKGKARRQGKRRRTVSLERLGDRITPAVNAMFIPNVGMLAVFGDNLDNTIEVSRNAAGQILVNGGAVNVVGGTPTVANTARQRR